jgi:hypothetical protein
MVSVCRPLSHWIEAESWGQKGSNMGIGDPDSVMRKL